jgi:hypothetical protein
VGVGVMVDLKQLKNTTKRGGSETVFKLILISRDNDDFLKDNHISLEKLVADVIDELREEKNNKIRRK